MGRKSAVEMATMGPKIRLRSLIVGSYTPEEWVKRYKRLSESDQFRLWAQVEPKEIIGESGGLKIQFILNGVEPKKVIQARVITDPEALEAHHNDADEDEL